MKKVNIMFLCRHNMFRSRLAEAYFNKINKNPNIEACSRGLIAGWTPLIKEQREEALKLGIDLYGNPKTMSIREIQNQDIIVIVADDFPMEALNHVVYHMDKKRLIRWDIKDDVDTGKGQDSENISNIIKQLMKKIEEFVKELGEEDAS